MDKNINEDNLRNEKYSNTYSESSFWDKIKSVALKVGAKGIYYALILYYVLQKEEVPYKTKALIVGALGYFVLPIDFIPDFMPIIGYTDDATGLLLVVTQVSKYIDEEVKNNAKYKVQDWFNISDSELDSFI